MRISLVFLFTLITACLFANYSSADDKDYNEAKSYLLKVFNSTYIIPNNNARSRNKLTIDKCEITFSFTIDGAYDRQSCNMKYLDGNRIERAGNSINIVTKNEEIRVQLSNSKYKSSVLSLHYETNKYSEGQIISSLKKVILNCSNGSGSKDRANETNSQQAREGSHETTRKSTGPNSKTVSNIEKRQLFATLYNKNLTNHGLAHSVFSTGPDHTTLLINKIKMTEELKKGVMTDRHFISKLKKIGFKNIEFCEPSFQGGSNCQTFQVK